MCPFPLPRACLRRFGAIAVLALSFLFQAVSGVAQTPANEYRVGPGDVLRIAVYQNADLSLDGTVSEAGTIGFPLLGAVAVGGRTPAEIEALIAQSLQRGGFLQRPFVNVSVLTYRALQVQVLGFVTRPGRFALERSNVTVSELLAMAGGVLPAGADVATLTTRDATGERRIAIDVPRLLAGENPAANVVMRNGDVLFVPRAPVFYVQGEVSRPGQYRLERDMTAMQALAVAGGITPRGTARGLRVNRRDASGGWQQREVTNAERIQPDDVVIVRESLF